MTATEVRELLPEIARSVRGYVQWREAEIARQANANGTSIDTEATELRMQWVRCLERVDIDAARVVLRRIEQGELDSPPYGQLPAFIRREARGHEAPRLRTPTAKMGEEPTYRCWHCWDSGIVEVMNPAWIRQHQDEIAAGLPEGWFAEARYWCREHSVGHLKSSVVCYCDSPIAAIQREQLAKFHRRELPKGVVPTRRCVFNDKSMASIHSNDSRLIARELQTWIADYDSSAAFEWQPNPDDYEAYV